MKYIPYMMYNEIWYEHPSKNLYQYEYDILTELGNKILCKSLKFGASPRCKFFFIRLESVILLVLLY